MNEVADRDVGPLGACEHLLEPVDERRVGRGVEDVHDRIAQPEALSLNSAHSL